jgi:hypothetical protein
MLKITNRLALVVLTYLMSWTVSYSVIMKFDFRYYFEYLRLASVGRVARADQI